MQANDGTTGLDSGQRLTKLIRTQENVGHEVGTVGHVDAPSLETFKVSLDGALSNLI